MKRAMRVLPFLLVSSLAFAAERPKLAVLLVVDQLGADTFEARVPLATAGIKRMLEQGFRVQQLRYQSAPTVTSVGHATLVTGSWPQTHGITANEWFDESLQKPTYSTEDSRYRTLGREPKPRDCTSPALLRAPTLGDSLKAWNEKAKVVTVSGKERSAILPGGASADLAIWIDAERGVFTTSTYYSNQLPDWLSGPNGMLSSGINQEQPPIFAGKLPLARTRRSSDGGFEGPLNERFELQGLFEHAEVDATLAAVKAFELGKDEAADFLSVSFSGHDFLAHAFGPDAPEVVDDFRRLDFEIGRLLDGLDGWVGKGKYVVALTSDHGGSQNPDLLKQRRLDAGRVDGRAGVRNALEAEADAALGPGDWFTGWWTPGLFSTAAAKPKVHSVDARIVAAGRKLDGVAEVLPLPELMNPGSFGALGEIYRRGVYPGRSPDFIVVPRPYWIYGMKDSASHATAWLYDRAVPLILFGGGVKKGELELAEAVDVAPTLAALVGAPAPAASVGRALQIR
jgi:hypothetical protein